MAGIKIVDLPPLGRDLASTDLLELSLAGGTGSRKITGQEIMNTSKLNIGTTAITSGTVGRVLFEGTGNVVQESANLFWDNTNGRLGIGTSSPSAIIHSVGSVTASGAIARGNFLNNTLVAAANSDVLVGLDINPVFTVNTSFVNTSTSLRINANYAPPSFSGNNNQYGIDISPTFRDSNVSIGLRINPNFINISSGGAWALSIENTSYGAIRQTSTATPNIFAGVTSIGANISGNTGFSLNVNSSIKVGTVNTTGQHLAIAHSEGGATFSSIRNQFTSTSAQMLIDVASQGNLRLFGTGNVAINSSTDAGFRLDVNGTARVVGPTFAVGDWTSRSTSVYVRALTGGSENRGFFIGTGASNDGNVGSFTYQPTGNLLNIRSPYNSGTVALSFEGNTNSTQFHNISGTAVSKFFSNTGNWGINTTTDAGFKLDVNGTVRVADNNQLGWGNGNYLIANNATPKIDCYVQSSLILTIGQTLFTIAVSANTRGLNPSADNTHDIGSQFGRYRNGWFAAKLKVGDATAFDASAKLQVDSTTLGFLPPRMTQTQRNAIASPAIGLEIYQTDATEGKYIYKSSGWTYIG
jgi:hypothetical protein